MITCNHGADCLCLDLPRYTPPDEVPFVVYILIFMAAFVIMLEVAAWVYLEQAG